MLVLLIHILPNYVCFNNVSLKFLKEIYVREPAFEDLQRSVRALNSILMHRLLFFN